MKKKMISGLAAIAMASVLLGAPSGVPAQSVCGDGQTTAGEDCDDGGTCIGGTNAGTACRAEAECAGNGVCVDGAKFSAPCAGDADCAGGHCRHCVPQGGDGCAANCTFETAISYPLEQGVLSPDEVSLSSGSGAVVHGATLTLPLELSGEGAQTVVAGKPGADGTIPVVVKADSVHFPWVPLALPCACARGVAVKTCGGTAFTAAGEPAQDCTPGYSNDGDTSHDGPCPVELPCAFVHGAGNSASGMIGCNGLDGVNLSVSQDDADGSCLLAPPRSCSHQPVLSRDGHGGPGSAILLNSTAIGTVPGPCPAAFCTDADPFASRANLAFITLALTTGVASGQVTNANGNADATICACAGARKTCEPLLCTGPLRAQGAPISCTLFAQKRLSGAALAGVFTTTALGVQDEVGTLRLVAQRECPGDCNADNHVGIDELMIGVNVALGRAHLDQCPSFDIDGDGVVTIGELVHAVLSALNECAE